MRFWARLFFLAIALLSCFPASVLGQGRELIAVGKQASVLVEIPDIEAYATAFCVHPSGLFVTNDHVAKGVGKGKSLRLVIDASLGTERVVEAKLVRVDSKNDLAIFKATSGGGYPTLKLANNASSFETMGITAFGYPFGKQLALEKGTYPSISINTGKITSLRREKGEIQLIQLDAALNPGNSGGAVLNDQGEVVGIVSFGVKASGVNFAIPVEKLKALLSTPHIEAIVPNMREFGKTGSQKIAVTLTPLEEKLVDPTVELLLNKSSVPFRTYSLTRSKDYRFEGVLTPEKGDGIEDATMNGNIEFEKGRIEAQIANEKLTTENVEVWLSDVNSIDMFPIDNPSKAIIQLRSGRKVQVEKSQLPKIRIDLGNYPATVALSRVVRLQLDEIEQKDISYTIVVKSSGNEICRKTSSELIAEASVVKSESVEKSTGEIAKTGEHTKATGSGIPSLTHKDLIKGKQKILMPGRITDVILSGGGEYLAIKLGAEKKLAVVNLLTAAIVGSIPIENESILIAGTADHLFLVDPVKGVMERYSLRDLKRQSNTKIPFDGKVTSIAAGYASQGPLLVCRNVSTEGRSRNAFAALDLNGKDLRLKDTSDPMKSPNSNFHGTIHIRGSANGKTFGMWTTEQSPQVIQTAILTDNTIRFRYQQSSAGFVAPSADGMYVLTGSLGAVKVELEKADRYRSVSCVPTSHPRLYFGLETESMSPSLKGKEYRIKASILGIGSEKSILEIPDFELFCSEAVPSLISQADFSLDKRLHYLVSKNLLVSVPFTNDCVVLQGLSFRNALKATGTNHFFIASTPPSSFTLGTAFSHQIQVETNQNKVSYELTSGPKGMEILNSGKLTWSVPDTFSESSVDVIIAVSSGEKYQLFESFTLDRVEDAKTK